MGASTTPKVDRVEQCRRNARDKSQAKRKAAFEALSALQREGKSVTKSAVAKRAGVSVVFIRSHVDLVQAVEDAERARPAAAAVSNEPASKAKDVVIASLKRRLDDMKRALDAKEAALRLKQREIDSLYGKLVANSPLTGAEASAKLQELLRRVTLADEQVADLRQALFAKRYVRVAQKLRRKR